MGLVAETKYEGKLIRGFREVWVALVKRSIGKESMKAAHKTGCFFETPAWIYVESRNWERSLD